MENPPKKLATINNLACYSIFINNYEWFNKNKTYFYKWILNHKVAEATE
jgi:Gpi18-like mannosyltransferase